MVKQGSIELLDVQTEDMEIVKDIVLKGLMNFRAKIFLFGSFATGKAGRISDIDIAVLPLEPLPVSLLSEIREQFEESNALYEVDLVDLSGTDSGFNKRVYKEGILWKE